MKTNAARCLSNIEILESRIAPATLTVMNTGDAGPGSLRAAIITANATSGDRIVFGPAAHGLLTLLTGQLDITSSMTIVGPGPSKLIINGNANGRVFDIDNTSTTNDSPVSISGLSIVNGSVTGLGGAISAKESLTLRNVVISGNTSTGDGGGIYFNPVSADAKLNISSSTITGNTSLRWGGGIFEYGAKSVILAGTAVSGNAAGSSSAYFGGGLYAEINNTSTTLSISRCQFTGNMAGYAGGLLLNDANAAATSKITITGTFISGNTAQAGSGGGLPLGNATFGGGHASITGSTIQGNIATGSGGGIDSDTLTSLAIGASVIEGNQANGTAIHAGGGGVWLNATAPVTITGTKFLENSTQGVGGGGGLLAIGGINLKLVSSVVSGNIATHNGGGVSAYEMPTAVTIIGGQFTDNTGGASGGGLSLFELASATITGSRFTGNIAGDGGGGLFLSGVATMTVKGVAVLDNFASQGGGVFVDDSIGKILGSPIFDNTALRAGGVFIAASTLTLQEAKVTGNIAGTSPNIDGNYTPFP
jgi:fibronectin-binding autotransporter adhesin